LRVGLAAAAAAITGSIVAAPAASAAPINGCPDFDFCFYFNSGYAGARADYVWSDATLDNELFNHGGANGQGVQVKNNAASAVNNYAFTAVVYFNSGCNGSHASQSFGAFSKNNFNATMKNNNASFKWLGGNPGDTDCANRDQF
jgi:peptidase inhibitor family I36